MSCDELDRWLDQGAPDAGAESAHAHARGCPRCAEILMVDQALERALIAAGAPAPRGFTERVMARIESFPRPVPWMAPAIPLWIRVAMEPVTAMALVIAGLILWGFEGLSSLAGAIGAMGQEVQGLSPVPGLGESGVLALELALASLLSLAAWPLFRVALRLARRPPLTRP